MTDSPDCCRRSFGASLKDTAKRLLEDPTAAPRAVMNERLQTCEQCDHYLPMSGQCDLCGCFMKLKTAMANSRCPIDKWEEWRRGGD